VAQFAEEAVNGTSMTKKEGRLVTHERAAVATLVLVTVCLAGASLAAQAMRAVPRVSIDELKTLMAQKAVVIVDVRTADEFKQGHSPGAVNVNFTDVMGEAERFGNEKRTIVAYCACSREMTAARAALDFAARGVPGVKALTGGWNEWLERKEPVEK
jgi:rhodanese-related sulfurtransferase